MNREGYPKVRSTNWTPQGLLVKDIREELGMTQEELAEAACLSVSTIVRIEIGVYEFLTPSAGAVDLAKVLGIEVHSLIAGKRR